MPRRTFTVAPPLDDQDPIEFDLVVGGATHTFHCLPRLPFVHFLRFGQAVTRDDETLAMATMAAIVESAVVDEERDAFRAVLESTKAGTVIDDQQFAEIFQWLVGVYSRRPTPPPSGSSPTPLPPGTTIDPASNGQGSTLLLTPVTG
jgi:hypothetical protein